MKQAIQRRLLLGLLLGLSCIATAMADGIRLPGTDAVFRSGAGRTPADTPWWSHFEDSLLEGLILEALKNNQDLAAAGSRLRRERARAEEVEAALSPGFTFDTQINATPSRTLGFQFGSGALGGRALPSVIYNGTAVVNGRYEIDVWGSRTLAHQAASLATKAFAGDRDDFALSLTTQIGEAYLDAALAAETRTLIEQQIDLSRSILELVKLRFQKGDVAALDLVRQRRQVSETEALLPAVDALEETSQYRLAALAGRSDFTELPKTRTSLPALPEATGTGRPIDLLDRRPDLRSQRSRVLAARARSGSVDREGRPSLQLSANGGLQGFKGNDLSTQYVWGAGIGISYPLFDAGRIDARHEQALEEESEASRRLNQLVLNAISETERGFVDEREQGRRVTSLEKVSRQAKLALGEARKRYLNGVEPFQTVLSTLQAYQQTELNLVRARRELLGVRLRLYRSLGGTWTQGLLGGLEEEDS